MRAGRRGGRPPEPGLPPLGPAGFQAATGVSRETVARLERYLELLRRWQGAINLVGRRSLEDPWRRHFLDSAQLARLAQGRRWLDLGSGAGFPGLVLAILGVGEVELVESDGRKAAFLAAAARETGTPVVVHNRRIEELSPQIYDVVTARALAPLVQLLELAQPFLGADSTALFLKGQDIEVELTEAAKCWKVALERQPSLSDSRGTVVVVRGRYERHS